jgi:hypothetical protein
MGMNTHATIEELLDVSFSVWSVLYQRKVGGQFYPELFVSLFITFSFRGFCVYITLHIFLVVVFHDGNPMAGLFIFNVITLDAAVIRLTALLVPEKHNMRNSI